MLCLHRKDGSKQCHLFNPRNLKYERIAAVPDSYVFDHLVAYASDVYCIGYIYKTGSIHVLKYDFKQNQWNVIVDIPIEEAQGSASCVKSCIHDGLIYIILYNGNSNWGQFMSLNPRTGSVFAGLHGLSSRVFPVTVSYEGFLYVETLDSSHHIYKIGRKIDANTFKKQHNTQMMVDNTQMEQSNDPIVKKMFSWNHVWVGKHLFYKLDDNGAIHAHFQEKSLTGTGIDVANMKVLNLHEHKTNVFSIQLATLQFPEKGEKVPYIS